MASGLSQLDDPCCKVAEPSSGSEAWSETDFSGEACFSRLLKTADRNWLLLSVANMGDADIEEAMASAWPFSLGLSSAGESYLATDFLPLKEKALE